MCENIVVGLIDTFGYEYIDINELIEDDMYIHNFNFKKEGYVFNVDEDIVFESDCLGDKVVISKCKKGCSVVSCTTEVPYSYIQLNTDIDYDSLKGSKLTADVIALLKELENDLYNEVWLKLRLACGVIKE